MCTTPMVGEKKIRKPEGQCNNNKKYLVKIRHSESARIGMGKGTRHYGFIWGV